MRQFGERGREATRADLAYHLEFIRPVLEFGILQPFVDYLQWLESVLASRNVPSCHLPLSLDWLKEFFDAHLPGDDARIIGGALEAGKTALLEPRERAGSTVRGMPEAWDACDEFEALLLAGEHKPAAAVFRRSCDERDGFLATTLHLVQPAMYGIGQKWQENRISVAREHLATAVAHAILAQEFAWVQPVAPSNRKIVLACVEGNQHALGLMMVADSFELQGWQVQNLGPNTPTRSLVDLVCETRPDMVGLSVSLPLHFPAAREAIAAMRDGLGESCPAVMLGGVAINQFSPLARILGADVSAENAQEAVRNADFVASSNA